MRGGLGRTRTSNQTVMVRARNILVPQGLSPRDAEVRVDEPKNRIIAIILADGVYAPDIDGHDRPFTPACMPSILVTRRNLARSLD
jgi:hypothetical protein